MDNFKIFIKTTLNLLTKLIPVVFFFFLLAFLLTGILVFILPDSDQPDAKKIDEQLWPDSAIFEYPGDTVIGKGGTIEGNTVNQVIVTVGEGNGIIIVGDGNVVSNGNSLNTEEK